MPACIIATNARVGLYYDRARTVPNKKKLDLFTVIAVNLLLQSGFKCFPLVVAMHTLMSDVFILTYGMHSVCTTTYEHHHST